MSSSKMAERFEVMKVFEGVLATEAAKRRDRWAKSPDGEYEFVTKEREAMMALVNRYRAKRDLPSVDVMTFMRAERNAVGHSDYGRKLCLYSTFMALGEEWLASPNAAVPPDDRA